MLFVNNRTANHFVEKSFRLAVLESLEARGYVPMIRTARRQCFEQALAGGGQAGELERAVAVWQDAEGDDPYVRGDVFFGEDHACFLVFADGADMGAGHTRAGLIHTEVTAGASQKLEVFCRDVRDAVAHAGRTRSDDAGSAFGVAPDFDWSEESDTPEGGPFSGGGGVAGAAGAGNFGPANWSVVAEILEDHTARNFLRRLGEAQAGGGAGELLAVPAPDSGRDDLVTRLAGAGLVRREVQVSCRKDGRSLFRLPSAEALAIVTASNAVCSECGLAIADERAEELLSPTPLASSLLKGGGWLVNRMREALASLGFPERDVYARPAGDDGVAQLVARVCGEQFLFVLNDGDFTAAQARRALDAEAETQASRLFVVATGRVHEDARARLREFARRRSRAGVEAEVHFAEGAAGAAGELSEVAERVARQALARELFALDAAAGFNVGYMVAARFTLGGRPAAPEHLSAEAAGDIARPHVEA